MTEDDAGVQVPADASKSDVQTVMDAGITDSGTTEDAPVDMGSGSCAMAFTGVLATWDFMGEMGNQASTSPKTMAPGVTASPLTRSMALTPVSGSGSINSSNWAVGAIDKTRYYTFSITPPQGCAVDVGALSITLSASGTGPMNAAVATSDDNYTKTTNVSINGASNPMLGVTAANGKVEIRVFGYNAQAMGGTLRMTNTVSVSGALK